jgi:hypothetical protein
MPERNLRNIYLNEKDGIDNPDINRSICMAIMASNTDIEKELVYAYYLQIRRVSQL